MYRSRSPLSTKISKKIEKEGVSNATLNLLNNSATEAIKYYRKYSEEKDMNDPKNAVEMIENIFEEFVSPLVGGYSENIMNLTEDIKNIELNSEKRSVTSKESIDEYLKKTGYSFAPALERIKKRYPEHFGS